MRRTIMISLACLAAIACSRNDTNSENRNTSATANDTAPRSNALNDNPSGATPMTQDPSGVAAPQARSADGVELAGGGREAGIAIGGGPSSIGETPMPRADAGAQLGASDSRSNDKGWSGPPAKGAKRNDDAVICPGDNDVRVTKNGGPGFCARACRSDIDCAPNGKCAGSGETSAKGYSQPNGKYCMGL